MHRAIHALGDGLLKGAAVAARRVAGSFCCRTFLRNALHSGLWHTMYGGRPYTQE
jgi:hypothetical protein